MMIDERTDPGGTGALRLVADADDAESRLLGGWRASHNTGIAGFPADRFRFHADGTYGATFDDDPGSAHSGRWEVLASAEDDDGGVLQLVLARHGEVGPRSLPPGAEPADTEPSLAPVVTLELAFHDDSSVTLTTEGGWKGAVRLLPDGDGVEHLLPA